MIWSSQAMRGASPSEMVRLLAEEVLVPFGNKPVDLAVFFVSPHFRDAFEQLPAMLQEHLPARVTIGCSAGGVVGGGLELENEPAMSLTAAHLPDVEIIPLAHDTENLPDADAPPQVWKECLGLGGVAKAHFILLADPFTSRLDPLPKLRPAMRISAPWYSGMLVTKSGLGEPSAL